MLHVYGSPLSSPTNKVRYVANYLQLTYEFHHVQLAKGEHHGSAYLEINPYGKVPAIVDDGFKLAESNAIIRYLASKSSSVLYPNHLQQRAVIDQWMDFASFHVMMALSKIMYNTYFYKLTGVQQDERSLQDGRQLINQYLPIIENQLTRSAYIAGVELTLADISMLAALDTSELTNVDLSNYTHIAMWRKKLMSERFYTDVHLSYSETFKKILSNIVVNQAS